jgi:antitoxin CptB
MPQRQHQIEDLELRKKRLKFRAWHRGTREMDLLLGSFADRHIMGFTEDQVGEFETLLELSDPDLYNWISGQEKPPEELKNGVFALLMTHRFAE